ncbi:hypothetical protein DMB66_40425 [Actinoplanes sp. ATCC 53533]|nr:hypothetical protein DMB66_40425 [Actinoplanes sp. ATCC 53533]
MGVNPHSDDLASAVGGHTFNGPAWSGTNTASGRPLWMEGISTVARSGNIRISFSLDGLFGAGGRTVAGSAEEAFSANYARGLPMVADWKLGAGRGNGTAWELATVGRAVRLGNRDWSSIDWFWQEQKVDLANPFG